MVVKKGVMLLTKYFGEQSKAYSLTINVKHRCIAVFAEQRSLLCMDPYQVNENIHGKGRLCLFYQRVNMKQLVRIAPYNSVI